MALKEKFFAMIASLNESEKQQLRDALGSQESEPEQPAPDEPEQPTDATPEETPEGTPEAGDNSESKTDAGGDDTDAAADKTEPEDESIPSFDKSEQPPDPEQPPEDASNPEQPPDEGATPESAPAPEAPETVSDEQGDDMPMDYQQIIDGLNAKIMALEAENAGLKAKTEGAFGLQSKPGEFARANPLYDDDTSDIHIRK